MSKEIAKKDETSLVSTDLPDFMQADSSRGSEDVSANDITLPRLSIIQSLSPQWNKKKDEYIEGAEVGDVFNTVSKELYKGDIMVIPCYFKVEHIIWKKQDEGGGFFGSFDTAAQAASAMPKIVVEDGGNPEHYEVVDTHVHYVVILKAGSTQTDPIMEQAAISMSKSQNKVSRKWNTIVQMRKGDRFSSIYKLSVVEDQNRAGQEYQNWGVAPLGYASEAMFKFAEQTYEAVKAGQVKAGHEQDAPTSSNKAAQAEGDFDDEFDVG